METPGFHLYLVQNFASLLTAVNAVSLTYQRFKSQNKFYPLDHCLKCICKPLSAFVQTKMTDFLIFAILELLLTQKPIQRCGTKSDSASPGAIQSQFTMGLISALGSESAQGN